MTTTATMNKVTSPLFDRGQVVSTPGAIDTFGYVAMAACLGRHLAGDWGDLCDEDKAQNQAALTNGNRIFSAYNLPQGKLWIITEAADDQGKREATTFLLPSEY